MSEQTNTPGTPSRTWTKFTFVCQSCHQRAYASQDAIDSARENEYDATVTDKQIAAGFEYCLSCATGEAVDGERVEGARFSIRGLTAQQVLAIESALLARVGRVDLPADDATFGALEVVDGSTWYARQEVSRGKCDGQQDEYNLPSCDGPDVRQVWFLAPGEQELSGKGWQTANWCAECRVEAQHKLGYVLRGAAVADSAQDGAR